MTTHEIVIRSIITEKSVNAIGSKKYIFGVARNTTKIDIAYAAEELFKIKIAKVNTLYVHGHLCHQGRIQGYTAAWKRAVVSLTESNKSIEFSEGMI